MGIIRIDPDKEYRPLEIAKKHLIRSRLNKGSYIRVLNLIKAGRLRAINYEINSQKRFWLVKGRWIIEYLEKYEQGRFKIERIKSKK